MGILDQQGMDAVKVMECGENMEILSPNEFQLHPLYIEWGFSKSAEIKLRQGVLEKLRKAKLILNKIPGCEEWNFRVWDGFRTLETQALLYIDYEKRLRAKHPDWPDKQIYNAVEIFVSPPRRDKGMPAPHNTGGAVDLTLVDEIGREIAMGTKFDEFNIRSYTAHFSSGKDDISQMDERAMPFSDEDCEIFHRNRMLLMRVMEQAGFVNYHEEWWHFSYGDQDWARQHGLGEAIYGSMEL